MQARAAAAEEATERILDAAEELFWENPVQPVTMAAAAERAGVSVHSIIRRFGGQEGMVGAVARRSQARASVKRDEAVPGDLASTIHALMNHYESLGDRVLALLAAEGQSEALAEIVEQGRELHVTWCERFFASALARRRGRERRRLLAQLVAVCDVYTWELLRRRRGLGRRETELALIELLDPLVNGKGAR